MRLQQDPARIQFSQSQRRAIEHRGGPMVVLAGPGSGKTRVITQRVASLIDGGAEPESIVAVTFTTKAAGELRERLNELVGGGKADRVRACTFHALGLHLLTRFGDEIGLGASPTIIDSAQERRLLRELLAAGGWPDEDIAGGWDGLIDRCLDRFAPLRHHAITPARALEHVRQWHERVRTNSPGWEEIDLRAQQAECERFRTVARLFERFEGECQRRGWLTLDHLITTPIRLLDQRPGVAAIVRSDWRHLVVDEFQDVNTAQIELLRRLAPPTRGGRPPDLCVVGDDDQSIYGFRGADDRAFHRFGIIWKGHATVTLSENHRSVPGIVAAGNAIIRRATSRYAPDKESRPARAAEGTSAPPVECVELASDFDDGPTIARMILLDQAARPEDDRDFGRYAVIARSHADLDRIERALRLEDIPVVVSRKASPRDDDGVKDLLAWADLLCEPDSIQPAKRLLARPPYSVSGEELIAWERSFRAAQSRWIMDQAAAPPFSERTFLSWTAARHGPGSKPARLAKLCSQLAQEVSTRAADAAILAIINRADLAHADLVAGARRARRLAALVTVVRFTRDRLDRLDPPSDLAAWRRYLADLRGDEAQFREIGLDPPDADERDARESGGVSLLTAHGAKGLQFSVVFVPRVSPPHGYPKTGAPNEHLPEGLEESVGDSQTVAERARGEERRVFYVACTRAQDRLVLMAKRNKNASKTEHYFEEFTRDEGGRSLVAVRGVGEIDRKAMDAGILLSGSDGGAGGDTETGDWGPGPAGVIARARRAARAGASEALHGADRTGHDPATLGELGAGAEAALRRLAAIAELEAGHELPAWANTDPSIVQLAERIRARERGDWSVLTPAPTPPLRLSYTRVQDYLTCPACYYLKHEMGLGEASSKNAVVGVAVHQALEQFYQLWRQADAEGRFRPTGERLLQLGRECLVRATPASREVEAEPLARVEALLRLAYDHFHEETASVLEVERTVRFTYRVAGHDHTFEAKLDRIDQLPDGRLRVVDYKTGQARPDLAQPSASDLQMGIYRMALEHLMGAGADSAIGEYWLLQGPSRGRIVFSELDRAKVRNTIDGAIEGILAGKFAPSKEHMKPGSDRPCVMLRDRA